MSSSTLTQIFLAYSGSSACSASMNAAVPQIFWTSAMACRVSVVFQEDSGQYISIILHFAYHHPRASSRFMLQDETVSTFIACLSPIFITEPTQNCFSIINKADLSASFLLSVISKFVLVVNYLIDLRKPQIILEIFEDLSYNLSKSSDEI